MKDKTVYRIWDKGQQKYISKNDALPHFVYNHKSSWATKKSAKDIVARSKREDELEIHEYITTFLYVGIV